MTFTFGDFELDTARHELRARGEVRALQPQIFTLLAYLVEHRDRVVTKDELLQAVWPDVIVSDGSLQRAVSLARDALGDDGRTFIRTLSRIGYRFAGVVEAGRPADGGAGAPPRPRYARSGDVHIAYQVFGEGRSGAADLVLVHGWTFSMASTGELPELAAERDALSRLGRLIVFDKRGTGLSDRVKDLPGLATRMDDLRAVLDEVGSARAVLVGITDGGPMSLLFAATYPERVEGLVLVSSFPRMAAGPGFACGASQATIEELRGYIRRSWGAGATLAALFPSRAHEPRVRAWAARAEQAGASPGAALELLEMNLAIDVREVLPSVRVPAVVVHRAEDSVVDVGNARYLAERLAGSRLVEVPGRDPLFAFDDPELIAREAAGLLAPQRPVATTTFLATVLAVELEAAATETGDAARGNAIAQPVLEKHRAGAIDAPVLAAYFRGPGRGLACARALAAAFEAAGLRARVGLHVSEVTLAGTEVRAAAAAEVARAVARRAAPSEVLVTAVVAAVAAGRGLRFEPRGEMRLGDVTWPILAAFGS